jgi:cephalosporin hydroxylase
VSLYELGCTFLGRNCSQSWADFQLWERLFNGHPELKSVVELGTGEGGFSHYLNLQCVRRGLAFATFDHVQMDGQDVPGFGCLDVFADPQSVASAFVPPTVLFCDDGDKPREVALFAPLLEPGDLVVVHDWNVEIIGEDIPLTLRPVHQGWCRELQSHSRVFVRVAT